jgi:hypothetical protein
LSGGFFRHGPPFIGWWVAPLAWVGSGLWLAWVVRAIRRRPGPRFRPEGLLVLWALIGVGASQTVDLHSQRSVGIAFVWALAAGTGLVAVLGALASLVPPAERWTPVAAALVLVVIGLAHARGFYDDHEQIRAYGDPRTTAAYVLGWRLSTTDRPPSVLLATEPYFSAHGMANLQFLVAGQEGSVIDTDPFPVDGRGERTAPAVTRGQVVVLGVERDDAEHCALLARYPRAAVSQARTPSGTVLYTLYEPDPAATLFRAASPAGGRLVVADRSSPAGRPLTCP